MLHGIIGNELSTLIYYVSGITDMTTRHYYFLINGIVSGSVDVFASIFATRLASNRSILVMRFECLNVHREGCSVQCAFRRSST